jgi:hypothetical protein
VLIGRLHVRSRLTWALFTTWADTITNLPPALGIVSVYFS